MWTVLQIMNIMYKWIVPQSMNIMYVNSSSEYEHNVYMNSSTEYEHNVYEHFFRVWTLCIWTPLQSMWIVLQSMNIMYKWIVPEYEHNVCDMWIVAPQSMNILCMRYGAAE